MEGGIYQLSNIANGKFYIGSTNNFSRRRNEHLYRIRKGVGNSAIRSAILKYGSENFHFEKLEIVTDIKNLEQREQYYMDLLSPPYNIRSNASNNSGIKKSPEHIRKMVEASLKSDQRNKNLRFRKPVTAFGKNGDVKEFASVKEASRMLNLSAGNITKACKRKLNSCGGYIFKYKENGNL